MVGLLSVRGPCCNLYNVSARAVEGGRFHWLELGRGTENFYKLLIYGCSLACVSGTTLGISLYKALFILGHYLGPFYAFLSDYIHGNGPKGPKRAPK